MLIVCALVTDSRSLLSRVVVVHGPLRCETCLIV